MALYQTIVCEYLQVPEQFFEKNAALITSTLKGAADGLKELNGDVLAVNRCLHLSSSVVLRNGEHLDQAKSIVQAIPGMEEQDFPSVLTIAALYYLLTLQPPEEWVDQLRTCFSEKNWLLNPDIIRILEFDVSPYPQPA